MQLGHANRGFGVPSRACKHRWTELTGCQGMDGSEAPATDRSARGRAALHRSSREDRPRKWSLRAVGESQGGGKEPGNALEHPRKRPEPGQMGGVLLPQREPQRGRGSGQPQDFSDTGQRLCPGA